jgi:ATP-dependent RNA helicase RhlE
VHLPEPVLTAHPAAGRFQENSLNHTFADLGLSDALLRAVADEGYSTPTPVQAQAIPPILAGRDVLAGAQTGTGKTAGFTLPLLQRLAALANASASPARHPVRALILTPTRELAAQVEQSVRSYGRHVALRSAVIYGGVGMLPQITTLRRGVDILVATPGRLLDHIEQRTVDLSRVEMLVLDEADRMLDMGFINAIRRIIQLLPSKRQSLLFSATFSSEIRRLADGLLHSPVALEVARRQVDADLVAQRVHFVAQDQKRHALVHLLHSGDLDRVLVFSRTKHGADRLAAQLSREGISASAIHGNKSQPQRTHALAEFKASRVRVLVATDIAARGLDIDALPHVVNFDLPLVAEDYVHRIGRTGRAGNVGEAISLVSPDERPLLLAIERVLKRQLERAPLGRFTEPVNGRDVAEQSRSPNPGLPRQQPDAREGMRSRNASQRSRPRKGAETPPGMPTGARERAFAARPAFSSKRPASASRTASLLGGRTLPVE